MLAAPQADWQRDGETGAIRHPEWKQSRIDFQPYPFASYTEKLVELLKQTHIAGENLFLRDLDPARVAGELVDERFVRSAIEATGSQARFALPASFARQETLLA